MRKLTSTIERTPEYVNFIQKLSKFHAAKGTTLQGEPILGKKRLDLLKLFKVVIEGGGFDKVTQNRLWKKVGNQFDFPKSCTNSAYILKGLYIRNLYGYEEEHVNGKSWEPPDELKGPHAHKVSTLAGSKYKRHTPQATRKRNRSQRKLDDELYFATMMNSTQDSFGPLTPRSPGDSPSFNIELILPNVTPSWETPHVEEPLKQKVLFSLRFGSDKDINWAVNFLLDLTFTIPHHLLISRTPTLIELLLDHGRPYIQQHEKRRDSDINDKNTLSSLMDMDDEDESTSKLDRLKKVLYVIRNYAMIDSEATKMATHELLKDLIISILDLAVLTDSILDIGRCCIDIVEKMAAHLPLAGPDDPWVPCLIKLIYSHDRHLVVGSIRALTVVGTCDLNHLFLADNIQVFSCVAQNIVSTDEELVGVSLEYLYQQVCASTNCRSQLLRAYDGVYVEILVEKLRSLSKYYVAKLIKVENSSSVTTPIVGSLQSLPLSPCGTGSTSGSSTSSTSSSTVGVSTSSFIPDLTAYTTLDEPYRCLGWLKDKFEATDASHTMSLDDIYLLYYSRFGTEKALKINHFYAVLSVAFPEQPPSHVLENGQIIENPVTFGTKINGLCIQGIQIKMNILHDEVNPNCSCRWIDCTDNAYTEASSLETHILQDHISLIKSDTYVCQWIGCDASTTSKDHWIIHLKQHAASTNSSAHPPSPIESSPSAVLRKEHIDSRQSTNDTSTNDISKELTGITLVAIHLLRILSEDPISITYITPYAVKLITTADRKRALSPFVYSILSNLRTHSTIYSHTSS